jgi:electron transfer flavoprotein beta subunit
MSMGVARAVHLQSETVPADPLAIATALAAELRGADFDLIMFGKLALDSANGAVGPMVAQLLDLPCVTACSSLTIEGNAGTARRELEGAAEIVEFSLPAVLTIDEGIARPRYPALKGIMAAKKKPLETKPAQLPESHVKVVSMELPADRPPGKIVGEGAAAVPELVRLLQTQAKVL